MKLKSIILLACLLGCVTISAWALPQPVGKNTTHKVGPEDTIFTISRKYGLAPDHILWANGLSEKRPPKEGQELLIPLRRIPPYAPASTAIVVNLPERMLYLFRGGRVVRYWGVAIGGSQYPTPSGRFRIIEKEKNPTWEPPAWLEREAIGPGPDNPLGDRWMQITPNMVGIHGTNNPDSIGGVSSLGCIRLYPEAIRELYDQVSVGTPVFNTYQQVRVGKEPDGTVIWSFFPDPYTRYFSGFQARDGIERAQYEGHDLEISDFEIQERERSPNGLITPVYGLPIKVEASSELPRLSAIEKPTGFWLNAEVLQSLGFEVTSLADKTELRAPGGKSVSVHHQKVPLNPHRIPRYMDKDFHLEGHRWKGSTWLPIPLALEYFEVEHKWDKKAKVLTLGDARSD